MDWFTFFWIDLIGNLSFVEKKIKKTKRQIKKLKKDKRRKRHLKNKKLEALKERQRIKEE